MTRRCTSVPRPPTSCCGRTFKPQSLGTVQQVLVREQLSTNIYMLHNRSHDNLVGIQINVPSHSIGPFLAAIMLVGGRKRSKEQCQVCHILGRWQFIPADHENEVSIAAVPSISGYENAWMISHVTREGAWPSECGPIHYPERRGYAQPRSRCASSIIVTLLRCNL